jgi:hypothetical protein
MALTNFYHYCYNQYQWQHFHVIVGSANKNASQRKHGSRLDVFSFFLLAFTTFTLSSNYVGFFFFLFDMSTQEGRGGFKLVRSDSLSIIIAN